MQSPCGPHPQAVRPFLLSAVPYLSFAVVVLIGSYLYFPRFGLYEDDYGWVGQPMVGDAHAVWGLIKWSLTSWNHGRPLHLAIGYALTFLSTRLGGLWGAFALAALIFTANGCLFYRLLARRLPTSLAYLSALAFCAYPADTSHLFLHVIFCVHTSLTLTLVAGHCYLSRRWVLGSLLTLAAFFTYEPCVMPLFALPLLRPWDRKLVPAWAGHVLTLTVVLALAVAARYRMHDDRLADGIGSAAMVARKVGELAVRGPMTSLGTFVTRPWFALEHLADHHYFRTAGMSRAAVVWAVLGCFVFLVAVLGLFLRGLSRTTEKLASETASVAPNEMPAQGWTACAKALCVGLVMLIVSYVPLLNRDPCCIAGRMSSVHIAGAFGATLIWGALGYGLLKLAVRRAGAHRTVVVLIGAHFALLVAFGLVVQRDFVQCWKDQRRFWSDLVEQCADMEDGTVILYPWTIDYPFALAHSWADPWILPMIYEFPRSWKEAPLAMPVGYRCWGALPSGFPRNYGWEEEITVQDNQLYFHHFNVGQYPPVPLRPGKVIFLVRDDAGRLQRLFGTLSIQGHVLPLKEKTATTLDALAKRCLYDYIHR